MSGFPFPDLLASLESEADQLEFSKVCNEVGLSASDVELGKLLRALQLYKAYYSTIPREIKAVHNAALDEMQSIRDEMKQLAERTTRDALKISQWAEQINQSILTIQPEAVTKALQKRLLEETTAAIGSSVQAVLNASSRIDTAAGNLNAAGAQAQASIRQWQTFSVRRMWLSNFTLCLILTPLFWAAMHFLNLTYNKCWNTIHYEINKIIHQIIAR